MEPSLFSYNNIKGFQELWDGPGVGWHGSLGQANDCLCPYLETTTLAVYMLELALGFRGEMFQIMNLVIYCNYLKKK